MCHGVTSRWGVRRVPAARLVTEMTACCVSRRGPRADSLRARSQTRTDAAPTPGISRSLLLFVSTPRGRNYDKTKKKKKKKEPTQHKTHSRTTFWCSAGTSAPRLLGLSWEGAGKKKWCNSSSYYGKRGLLLHPSMMGLNSPLRLFIKNKKWSASPDFRGKSSGREHFFPNSGLGSARTAGCRLCIIYRPVRTCGASIIQACTWAPGVGTWQALKRCWRRSSSGSGSIARPDWRNARHDQETEALSERASSAKEQNVILRAADSFFLFPFTQKLSAAQRSTIFFLNYYFHALAITACGAVAG